MNKYLIVETAGLGAFIVAEPEIADLIFSKTQYHFDEIDGPSFRISNDASEAILILDNTESHPELGDVTPYIYIKNVLIDNSIDYREIALITLNKIMHEPEWDLDIDDA